MSAQHRDICALEDKEPCQACVLSRVELEKNNGKSGILSIKHVFYIFIKDVEYLAYILYAYCMQIILHQWLKWASYTSLKDMLCSQNDKTCCTMMPLFGAHSTLACNAQFVHIW